MKIVADILTAALNGEKKTRIMNRANLNFMRFHRYCSELQRKGLIFVKHTSNGVVCRTTDKGRRFLKTLNDAEAIISS